MAGIFYAPLQWNGYRNKSQHRKLTLEKTISHHSSGSNPGTFWSWVWHSNHWTVPIPQCQCGSHPVPGIPFCLQLTRNLETWETNPASVVRYSKVVNITIVHSFYIVLFSALEQTHCAHWHVILNEWLQHFIACIINIHGSGVLAALCGCCMAGATWNAAVSAQVPCTPFNHAPGYSVTSFKAT